MLSKWKYIYICPPMILCKTPFGLEGTSTIHIGSVQFVSPLELEEFVSDSWEEINVEQTEDGDWNIFDLFNQI